MIAMLLVLSSERDAEFSPTSGPNPFHGIKLMEGEMEDEESSFLDLADRLAALQPRSRTRVTRVDGEVDMPVSPSRAEEALKSCELGSMDHMIAAADAVGCFLTATFCMCAVPVTSPSNSQ